MLFAKAVVRATGESQPAIGPRYLAVLYLLLIEQRSYLQVARKMGISEKTATMYRLKARSQLGYETLEEMERDLLIAYGIEWQMEEDAVAIR